MLLYSTLWIRKRDSCSPASSAPIHVLLDSFITRQVHGIAMHLRIESPFASLSPPLGPSRLLRVRQSAAATAENHRCHLPRRQQVLEQTSCAFCRKDGLRQATWGRRKLVVSLLELARHLFVDYLVGNLVELHGVHAPGVCRLVVECQAAKAEK